MNKAVFIDKDGTLIYDVPYNVDPVHIRLYPGVATGLKQLKAQGFLLIMVSNQSGVARGYFDVDSLSVVKQTLTEQLAYDGAALDGFYFCPHSLCGIVDNYVVDCTCRKPKPGMLLQAARDFNIDLSRSWMIGDILNDVEAGNRAGCRSILLDRGNETEWLCGEFRTPHFIANTFMEAAGIIVSKEFEYAEC